MPSDHHGTKPDATKKHPVLDIRHWMDDFPLGEDRSESGDVERPGQRARVEQARALARVRGDLGPSVPADIFVWTHSVDRDKPWLTRLGGRYPWREKNKPWPKDPDGVPLHFLGQICFADSKDILPCELPGEVAIIFGRWQAGWTFTDDVGVLEWSPIALKEPTDITQGWTTALPFCYQGVIHRSVQYTDWKAAEPSFKAVGYKHGGHGIHSIQATSIGTYANLPQGWPFENGDGNTLIATLGSFYFRGSWPLCDVPRTFGLVRADGSEYDPSSVDGMSLGIGDAGCIWIYRDKDGVFKLSEACG